MIKETYIFNCENGGSSTPQFQINDLNFGIQCKTPFSHSMYWYDNMGSVGKLYNHAGYNKQVSQELDSELNKKLITLTDENLNSIKSDIIKLLEVLTQNDYSAKFIEPQKEHNENGYNFYNIIFPKYDSVSTTEQILNQEFSTFFEQTINERGNNSPPKLLDFVGTHFYDGYENHLLATQHKSKLDKSRIKFYNELIQKGHRPSIIVLRGNGKYGKTNSFIIDGHHKAVAYQESKINPKVIELESEINQSNKTIENLIAANELLYPIQMIHLIRSNYKSENIFLDIKNHEILGKYCLNGIVEQYYPNGQLRVKGNFKDSKRDGLFTWYYPDGTLFKKEKYELEHWKATYEHYFHNGQLLIRGDDNGIIEQYNIYGKRTK
jgi:antitoxin component YwqK of YwqJK toxin-antitoxin module